MLSQLNGLQYSVNLVCICPGRPKNSYDFFIVTLAELQWSGTGPRTSPRVACANSEVIISRWVAQVQWKKNGLRDGQGLVAQLV